MVDLYIDDSNSKVAVLECALNGKPCPEYEALPGDTFTRTPDAHNTEPVVPCLAELDGLVHQLKGGSSSVGAVKVADACSSLRKVIKARGEAHQAHEKALREAAMAVCEAYHETERMMVEVLRLRGTTA